MVKLDKDYVKKLFKWLEEHEEIDALLNEDENCEFDLKLGLGEFLDLVCTCADEKNIFAVHKSDGYSCDNRFCYWVRYKDKIFEIGMYYDDVVFANSYPEDVIQEDIIDCEDILKLCDNSKEMGNRTRTHKITTNIESIKD